MPTTPARPTPLLSKAARLGATALAALLLAGCSPAPTPPAEPTPVPEDEPAPQAVAGDATQMRDAIQAPQDKARAVEDTLQQSADAQRAAIDAAESSAAPAGDVVTPGG